MKMTSMKAELLNPLGELRLAVASAIDEANEAASRRFFAQGDEMSLWSERMAAARKAAEPLN